MNVKNTSLNPFPDVEGDGTNIHWTDNKLRSPWLDLVKEIYQRSKHRL